MVEQGHRTVAGRRPGRGPGRARTAPGPVRLAGRCGHRSGRGAAAARPDDPVAAGFGRGGAGAVRRPAAARTGADRPGRAGRGQPAPGPGPGRRRDRVPARPLWRAGPRSVGRGTDDVRPGQFRALPAQDLQCQLEHRRARTGAFAVPDDPQHPPQDPAAHPERLQRQRRGDRRPRGRALPPGPGQWPVPHRGGAAVGIPDQGRDPQPSHRDLAVPGCLHRRRRRDPRRGCHRSRRQAQGRPDRLLGLAPAHSHAAAALGSAARAQPAHGPGAGDHDRWPARWRRLQQRVRPAQPAGLLPQFRAVRGRHHPRLRQADHAGRWPGRDRPHPGRQDQAAAGRCGDRARWAGDADRPGWRRGQLGGLGRERRGPGFRQRAARQPGDGASLPGGDRPLRGPGRAQPDPLLPRRRRRRPVQCHPRAAARLGRGRGDRSGQGAHRRSVAVAAGVVVQRIPGTLRAGRAGRPAGRVCRDLRARALPVRRGGRGHRAGAAGGGVWGNRREHLRRRDRNTRPGAARRAFG